MATERPGDRSRINLRDEFEVAYWCRKLSCTRAELFAATREVGSIAGDVRRKLTRDWDICLAKYCPCVAACMHREEYAR